MVEVKKLNTGEVKRFKQIRLRSLKENPEAFGTTFEQANSWKEEVWINQTQNIPAFIASVGGLDSGIVRVGFDDKDSSTAWLISMWVAPESRGNNLGGRLIDALIDWCKTSSLKSIKLDVGDFNQAAINLYEKKGFIKNGITGSLPSPRENISEHQRELKI
jgi:GNAT superfamily N-acetyltransferase